jgi:hypothetical protein
MALPPVSASTGTAPLPDVGTLSYNGITFTCLYTSKISGVDVLDNAKRTVMYMEYTIEVDGMVTLPVGATTTDAVWASLRQQLDAPAGTLTYSGKGFGPFTINPPGGGGIRDAVWGPIPKTLDFQSLGASRSAMIRWRVTTYIPEQSRAAIMSATIASKGGGPVPLLQFNEEIDISYDEDAFLTCTIKGTLEIPLTRATVSTRTLSVTVDNFRQRFLNLSFDLTRFRVTRRNFNISRDRRVCEWEYQVQQIPYQEPPIGCTSARGSFTIRPYKGGLAMTNQWICSLRCTYTVQPGMQRRLAWMSFVGLLNYRMRMSAGAALPPPGPPPPTPSRIGTFLKGAIVGGIVGLAAGGIGAGPGAIIGGIIALRGAGAAVEGSGATPPSAPRAQIIHFGVDEGLYLDSRTTSFEASWRLVSSLATLLTSAGLWRKLPSETKDGGGASPLYVSSVQNISGWKGTLIEAVDPSAEVIVDFGGPT